MRRLTGGTVSGFSSPLCLTAQGAREDRGHRQAPCGRGGAQPGADGAGAAHPAPHVQKHQPGVRGAVGLEGLEGLGGLEGGEERVGGQVHGTHP